MYLTYHSKTVLPVWEIGAILNCPVSRKHEKSIWSTAWMVISPESNDMNGAENDALWESGQKEHSFRVIRVLAVTSELRDLFLIFYCNNTLIF